MWLSLVKFLKVTVWNLWRTLVQTVVMVISHALKSFRPNLGRYGGGYTRKEAFIFVVQILNTLMPGCLNPNHLNNNNNNAPPVEIKFCCGYGAVIPKLRGD